MFKKDAGGWEPADEGGDAKRPHASRLRVLLLDSRHMPGSRFRVQHSEFRDSGFQSSVSSFGVQGWEFRVQGSRSRISGSRVEDSI